LTTGADACREAFGPWLDRVAAGEGAVVTRGGKPMVRLTAAGPEPLPPASPAPSRQEAR